MDEITASVTLMAGENIDLVMWHCIRLWNPVPDTVLGPENKHSRFPASIPGCGRAGAWSPIICVLCSSPRAWGGLKGFTPFHLTPQLSIVLFASRYPDVHSLPDSSIAFGALISLNWWFKQVFSLSSRMRPLVEVPQPQVMGRR